MGGYVFVKCRGDMRRSTLVGEEHVRKEVVSSMR